MVKSEKKVYGRYCVYSGYENGVRRYVSVEENGILRARYVDGVRTIFMPYTPSLYTFVVYLDDKEVKRICRKHFSGKDVSELSENVRGILTRTFEDDVRDEWYTF